MLKVCFAEYPQILLASLCSSVKSYKAGAYFFLLVSAIFTIFPSALLSLLSIFLANSSSNILELLSLLTHDNLYPLALAPKV